MIIFCLNIFSHDICNTSLLTHVVKIPILGCSRRSSINRVQVTRLIAVPSVLINVGSVARRILRYIYTVTIVVSTTRRDVVLGKHDNQHHIEIAKNNKASNGRALSTNSHSAGVAENVTTSCHFPLRRNAANFLLFCDERRRDKSESSSRWFPRRSIISLPIIDEE